jgi:hypothetical protein
MSSKGPTPMYDQRRVAEAAVVPGTRLPPPPELNEAESVTWRTIVERLPADWFTAENTPLLKELCRHIGHADALSVDIANVRAELAELASPREEPEEELLRRKAVRAATADYHALLRLHAFQTERIGNLATKMRLSQQTRLAPTVSRAKADSAPAGLKPWQGWDDPPPTTAQ